jgi:hypothetical protein
VKALNPTGTVPVGPELPFADLLSEGWRRLATA